MNYGPGDNFQIDLPVDIHQRPEDWGCRDNINGMCSETLAKFIDANFMAQKTYVKGYGADQYSRRAAEVMRAHFGPCAETYFTLTGSGANMFGVSLLQEPRHVILSDNSHMLTMEGHGPVERHGMFPRTITGHNGKLDIYSLRSLEEEVIARAKMVHITQPTELGVVYSLEELRQIGEFCDEKGLVFGMDGARLPQASLALGCSMDELTNGVGVDFVTLAVAKQGGFLGNAFIVLDRLRTFDKNSEMRLGPDGEEKKFGGTRLPEPPEMFRMIKAQSNNPGALWAVAVQFISLYEGDLWKKNGQRGLDLAKAVADELKRNDIYPAIPVETNALFLQMEKAAQQPLMERWNFFPWPTGNDLVRCMFDYTVGDNVPGQLASHIVNLRDRGLFNGNRQLITTV